MITSRRATRGNRAVPDRRQPANLPPRTLIGIGTATISQAYSLNRMEMDKDGEATLQHMGRSLVNRGWAVRLSGLSFRITDDGRRALVEFRKLRPGLDVESR